MLHAATGLTEVPTDSLVHLLRMVHRKELRFPLSIDELARIGLQSSANEVLPQLRDLDERAVRILLVCVIAERKAREDERPIGIPRS